MPGALHDDSGLNHPQDAVHAPAVHLGAKQDRARQEAGTQLGPAEPGWHQLGVEVDEAVMLSIWKVAATLPATSLAFEDPFYSTGLPGWLLSLVEMGYEIIARGADPAALANRVDSISYHLHGPEWHSQVEIFRNAMFKRWDREFGKLRREPRPAPTNPATDDDVESCAEGVVECLRKRMLLEAYIRQQSFPQSWDHSDNYCVPMPTTALRARTRSPRGRGDLPPSSSSMASWQPSMAAPSRENTAEQYRGNSPCPARRGDADSYDGETSSLEAEGNGLSEQNGEMDSDDSDVSSLVLDKWIIKKKKAPAKETYQTSKMIWRSARPAHRTTSYRTLDPAQTRSLLSKRCPSAPWRLRDSHEVVDVEADEREPTATPASSSTPGTAPGEGAEADTAEGLWMILLGLDPFGGSLQVPGDWDSMVMTLPHEVVENTRATLADHSPAEVEELRNALPGVMASIREELEGLIEESLASRSSPSVPPERGPAASSEAFPEEEEEVEIEEPAGSHDAERVELMQRTMTGMLKTNKRQQGLREDKLALHQELQGHPDGVASYLAQALRNRLLAEASRVEDWAAIDAVLAANTDAKGCHPTGEVLAELEEWVKTWAQRLLRSPQPGQASSSHEVPAAFHPPIMEPDTDDFSQRRREEENQEKADSELYDWHQKQLAAEAKLEDEVALQARLGTSTGPPAKRIRLKVEVVGDARSHYSEFEIAPGEELRLSISMTESATRHFRAGRPVPQAAAEELIQREEERLRRQQPEGPRESYNMEDSATKEMYQRWIQGRASVAQVAAFGGHGMVEFFEAVKDLDTSLVFSPTLPQGPIDEPPPSPRPQTSLAWTIETSYLGERWKELFGNAEYRGSYVAWRQGQMSEDLVVLRYGLPTMAVFRLLLERGYHEVPTPMQCGAESDAECDANTVDLHGDVRRDGATTPPDEAETLLLSNPDED